MDDSQPASTPWRSTPFVLVIALVAAPASAQLAQQAFQIAVDRFGDRCQGVETTRALGTASNGDALVAVACTNGGRHVVAIHTDNSVSYLSPCQAFETRTGITCFDSPPATR
ncbi:hypothetical protein [uncultured Thiocystis sp.]|jgi:hypothetical protein|uniref:hypothetical protein n=1 Tax=uncultured Thiocystis sp. TaxID=1202134 RepID=UPI0025EF2267|nr:hypothetical protein [uncultured Thiocystis sp.]